MGTFRIGSLGTGLGLILAASGCGGGASTTSRAPAAATTTGSAPTPAAAAPVRHLAILSPRAGAHTATTLTVRVRLTGPAGGGQRLRFVLDHRLTRSGSDTLTFHNLAPGHHRLEVFWAGADPSHTATTFTVRAPAVVPAPVPAQAEATPSTPIAPAPSTTPPPRTSPPPRTTTTPAPPPPTGGIPQGPNAGDGDADNSGGPSDGDGNV